MISSTHATTPPAPRPSFPRLLQSVRLLSNTASTTQLSMYNNCNVIAADKASDSCNLKSHADSKINKYRSYGNPSCSRSEQRPNQKSVRFNTKSILHPLDIPKASDMSSEEKEAIWYTSSEYDRLKHKVAKSAGVKVIKDNQSHRFVMMGDFDCKERRNDALSASMKNASMGTGTSDIATKKFYYNENEYNDYLDSNGEAVCKRGLGYHFSSGRRKSKVQTRSAVVAWQGVLRDRYGQSSQSFQQGPPGVGSKLGRFDNSQSMLALVSAKCSRVAREEAKWRGDVDYRVAYPERHESLATPPLCSQNKKSNATCGGNGTAANRKRGRDDIDDASRADNAGRKRQMTRTFD